MKSIDILVVGGLVLGATYMMLDYIPECVVTEQYIRGMPNGQYQQQQIKTGKCRDVLEEGE